MVYCGKPSKACEECRVRRTKCDALRPSCSQCVRARRVCKGYRDPTDLMFRDESEALSTKRQRLASRNKPQPASSPKETNLGLVHPAPEQLKPQLSLRKTSAVSLPALDLSASAQEQAACFFFRNYILEEHKLRNGYFQYLSDIYASEEIGDSLAETVECLGLVGLANFWKASSIMKSANIKYSLALRQVSSRLRNAEEAKSDQTLVAVMLLGLYETNTCSSPQSMKSWTKHVTGAAALLNLRGKQQLKTPIGHQLFVHLRGQVLTNCIQRHVIVPPSISEWSQAALEYETEEEVALTYLSEIGIKYCNIRASMASFHDYTNVEYVVARLCAIDTEYEEWVNCLPISFIYTAVTIDERSDDVFSDYYDVYSSIWIATAWNHYRCIRILINELILDQATYMLQLLDEHSPSSDRISFYESQIIASRSSILQLSRDICASVPFYLGYGVKSDSGSTRPPPKAISGNLLLWPLYTAACTKIVSEMMRDWVAGRLRVISDVLGIRQAAPLAYILSKGQDLLEWEEAGGEGNVSTNCVT